MNKKGRSIDGLFCFMLLLFLLIMFINAWLWSGYDKTPLEILKSILYS